MRARHIDGAVERKHPRREAPEGCYVALCGRFIRRYAAVQLPRTAQRCRSCVYAYRIRRIPEYLHWAFDGGPKPPLWD